MVNAKNGANRNANVPGQQHRKGASEVARRYGGNGNRQIHAPGTEMSYLELSRQILSLHQRGGTQDGTGFPMVVSPPNAATILPPFNSTIG